MTRSRPKSRRLLTTVATIGGVVCVGACSAVIAPERVSSTREAIVSSTPRHVPGLDEDVFFEIVRGDVSGSFKRVRRADGRCDSISDFREEEREARKRRFGVLTPEVRAALVELPRGATLPVTIQFDPQVNWTNLSKRLQSQNMDVEMSARAELRSQISGAAEDLTHRLRELGATNITRSTSIPFVYVTADRIVISRITSIAQIVAITLNVPSVASWLGASDPPRDPPQPQPPNSLADAVIDTSFNAAVGFGEGQRIAVVEGAFCGWFAGARFLEQQTEFTFSGIHYEAFPRDCRKLSDCNICGRGLGVIPFACVDDGAGKGNGFCVEAHASQAAGVIAASTNNAPHGSSRADLYFPNGGVPGTLDTVNPGVACQTEGIAHAYDWLTMPQQAVTTVSESFVCSPGDSDGTVQDWYSRYFNISIFRAAGNNQFIDTGIACRGLNMNCVGGNTINDDVWPSSTWMNPSQSDREEPDFTALAAAVDVQELSISGGLTSNLNVLFGEEDGTSYAAPAMASFAALLKQACGGSLDSRRVRAVMRTSAWAKNPDHLWRYSTPGLGVDHHDGAGEPTGDNAIQFCPGFARAGSPATFSDEIDVDLTRGGALPAYVDTTQAAPPDDSGVDAGAKSGGRVGSVFWSQFLSAGDRVRVTFTWDSCPALIGNSQPAIATDFDIFLCDNDSGFCLPTGTSESFDDNVEGFDTNVPYFAVWSLWYGFDPQTERCAGQRFEPAAFAIASGPEKSFQADPPPNASTP